MLESRYTIRPFDAEAQPEFTGNASLALPTQALCIEIGCGVGMHPIKFARQHPDKFLVAIEHTHNKFNTFKRSLQQQPQPLTNLMAVHANAITWISKLVPAASVEQYFLLYPNPWPKEKQRNQRWHQMPFMHKLLQTLKPGGTLTLASNIPDYTAEAEAFFQHAWQLQLVSKKIINPEPQDNYYPRTHFEKKYLQRGEPCTNLVVRKPL